MNIDVEIVLLATGDPAALDAAVLAVHRQLSAQAAKTWCLTIAVDDTITELHSGAPGGRQTAVSVGTDTCPGLDLKGRRGVQFVNIIG